MPNWCMNNVTIQHEDAAKIEALADAYKRHEFLDHFLPTPRDANGDLDNDWYDWRVENWATKWDVGGEGAFIEFDSPNSVTLSFESAWSPPFGVYQEMLLQGFKVHATYFEPGLCFCGIWDNGSDRSVQYDSGAKRETIPVALWNEFNMEEFFEDEEVSQ